MLCGASREVKPIEQRCTSIKRYEPATAGRGPSGGADRLMERGHPITISVPFLDQSVSGLGNAPPLVRIAEARYRIAEIGEIRVESDVVLVRGQNVIVPAAQQNLAGPGSRSIEVTGGDAFGVDRAARAAGKETAFDSCETHLPLIECLVPQRRNLQERLEPGLGLIREAPAQRVQ